ncbi:MAG: ATP-dependent zinc metalloprotease FtsH [Pirellulales bacterium]|nr:ATP-dependent zinc metalloprotease FtsH [Pirellulales bacterium]
MEERNNPVSGDKNRPSPTKGHVVWYLLAIAAMVMIVAVIINENRTYTIDFSDFKRFVSMHNRYHSSGDPEPSIQVKEGPADRYTVRYTDLESPVDISQFRVSGKIKRQVIKPDDKASDPEEVDFSTNRDPNDTQGNLTRLLESHGIEYKFAGEPSGWSRWMPMLLITSLFIIVFVLMMRRIGGAGSPMAFGRSRGKLYAQEDLGVTFDDVAGVDEAKEELEEVVEFLKTPEKYRALGGRIPKGVLLVGPPGTGKTLLAKAVAGEAGVPFFGLSGSDFVEMFVGVGAARVRDTFQQATQKAPSIIFIDELDALGKTRGNGMVGGHDEREQTLNALLVEMDGFATNSGVIVMGATNRPETLDAALLRPGRFDRQVLVDRPDVVGREKILRVHTKDVKLDDAVDVQEIATITSGFVGADIANVVNEAALLAARRGKNRVFMEEFNDAVERVTAGLEKKQRINDEEKERIAYHESGHALLGMCLPTVTHPVHKVSIIPRGFAALGYTMHRPTEDRYLMTQQELECQIQILLAGTLTEEIVFDDISTGAKNDLERASEIARSMVMDYGMSRLGRVSYREETGNPFLGGGGGDPWRQPTHSEHTAREIDEEVRRIIDSSIEKVRHILETRRAALDGIAEELLKKEVIDADDLKRLMDEHSPTATIAPGTDDVAPRTKADETKDADSSGEASEGGSSG